MDQTVSLHFFVVTLTVILIFFQCLCWFLVSSVVFKYRLFLKWVRCMFLTIYTHFTGTAMKSLTRRSKNREWWCLLPVSNFSKHILSLKCKLFYHLTQTLLSFPNMKEGIFLKMQTSITFALFLVFKCFGQNSRDPDGFHAFNSC